MHIHAAALYPIRIKIDGQVFEAEKPIIRRRRRHCRDTCHVCSALHVHHLAKSAGDVVLGALVLWGGKYL